MNTILILGAKSDIAKALAKVYAMHSYHLILAGRNIDELLSFKEGVEASYSISIQLAEFDVLKLNTHTSFFENLSVKPIGVICCIGYLGNQELAERNLEEANRILNTNFLGCVNILNVIATHFEGRKHGFIVGISSVAGERGRKSNYFYGSAKAGFTVYLSGLRARLLSKNIHVMTVKPGFVYTKMTSDLQLPKLLTSNPDRVAIVIYNAQKRKKNVLYVKWIWKYIMWIIKCIPEFIFKKMNL